MNSLRVKKAIAEVRSDIFAMSEAEFAEALARHNNGDIATIIGDLIADGIWPAIIDKENDDE